MNYVLANISLNNSKGRTIFKKMMEEVSLYSRSINLVEYVPFSAENFTNIGEGFKIVGFSKHIDPFDLFIHSGDKSSYNSIKLSDFSNINYICSCQNDFNEFYFQLVSRNQLKVEIPHFRK